VLEISEDAVIRLSLSTNQLYRRQNMTQPVICHLCVRRDPFTLLDWVCMPNGVAQPECLLRERNFGTPGLTPDHTSERSEGAQGSAGLKIAGLASGLANMGSAWKAVAAVVAMIAATLGGYSFRGSGTANDGSQIISHQLGLAQNCLDAGILDCAAHLVEPIARADPSNERAKKIDEAVKGRQASLTQHPPASNHQEEEALLALAHANVDYGTRCLTAGNLSCALEFSDLVLSLIPPDFVAGKQVRRDAEVLNDHVHLGR
jgi:hypothetical protein